MELRTPHMLGHNDTTIGRAIIRHCRHTLCVLWFNVVGVSKVEIGISWNTHKDRQFLVQGCDLVPTHMWNFWPMRNASHRSMKETQSRDLAFGMMVSQ